MSFPLVILALVFFAIASGILMRLAVRARAGTVSLSDPIRLRSSTLNSSELACQKGHEAAWLLLLAGSLVMDFHFIGLLLAAFFMGSEGPSFARVLALTGVIMAIALTLVARAAADSGAKDSTH